MGEERFFSIREAAEYLAVDYKTVYRLIKRGELPAGRIGALYRIRKEDLERYFELQKAKESCLSSDRAPPAVNTWLRCGRCLTVIPDSHLIAGVCQAPGCQSLLCFNCWRDEEGRFCRQHVLGQQEKLAQMRQALAEGKIPLLVLSHEAKSREIAFIARFDRKVHEIGSIRNPTTGEILRVDDWDQYHETVETTDKLLDILGVGYLERALLEKSPLNLCSRYTVPATERKRGLVIEAACYSRLERHVQQGYDTQPATLQEMLAWLEEKRAIVETSNFCHLSGMASTTGWESEAIEFITGGATSAGFSHRLLLPVLIDLHSGQVYSNPADERLEPLLSLFVPLLPGEQVQRVIDYVRGQIALSMRSLAAETVSRALSVDPDIVTCAFQKLAQEGNYRLDEIDPYGLVISLK